MQVSKTSHSTVRVQFRDCIVWLHFQPKSRQLYFYEVESEAPCDEHNTLLIVVAALYRSGELRREGCSKYPRFFLTARLAAEVAS